MSGISNRSTRKRVAVTYTLSSSESEDEATPKKKQKYKLQIKLFDSKTIAAISLVGDCCWVTSMNSVLFLVRNNIEKWEAVPLKKSKLMSQLAKQVKPPQKLKSKTQHRKKLSLQRKANRNWMKMRLSIVPLRQHCQQNHDCRERVTSHGLTKNCFANSNLWTATRAPTLFSCSMKAIQFPSYAVTDANTLEILAQMSKYLKLFNTE